MKKSVIKFRPLAPAEQRLLEEARDVIKPMCDLLRMVDGWPVATLQGETDEHEDGEMRRRFFELEKTLANLPSLKEAAKAEKEDPDPKFRQPLFTEAEKMKLHGYTENDKNQIRAITARLVEGRVLKGEVNPDDPESLKAAIKEAAHVAKSAYNAALEFVSG